MCGGYQISIAYCLFSFIHFSFSLTKFYITDFSASTLDRVFKFCIHGEDNQLCITENKTKVLRFIFAFFLLAHLSRRLIGELIVYQWSGVRCPSSSVVRRRPQCSNIFLSETAWPIKAKFYVEPPWVGGTKFCSRHLGHMTKMAATPIYGKNPSKIFFSRTGGPIFTKLSM